MFREMRRKLQTLSEEECLEIINQATSGTLAVLGDDDYPYAVPLSYAYEDGCIYTHCARTGHKNDAIAGHDKVCFSIIGQDKVVPELYTTYFRSVCLFGRASFLEDPDEILRATRLIGQRYRPGHEEEMEEEIDRLKNALAVMCIRVEHMSGKQSKYLLPER